MDHEIYLPLTEHERILAEHDKKINVLQEKVEGIIKATGLKEKEEIDLPPEPDATE